MKKRLLTYLLPLLLFCTGHLAAQVVTPATRAVNCTGTTTFTVNVGGALYYATTTGGLVIQDGGVDKSLVVTTQTTITVKAASGAGTLVISLATNPGVTVGTGAVTINPMQLGDISGTNLSNGLSCIPSTGTGTYSIPTVPGASYIWRITNGGQHTRILSSSGNTATIESINEGNSSLTVYVYNDCTGDLCSAQGRSISIKKTFSLAANETFGGPACLDASVLGEDSVLVYSVKPYLGLHNTFNDYAWQLSAGLEELYRSADGSSISLKVKNAAVDQQVSIVVGAACNGQSNRLTKILKAPAPAPIFAAESFCVSDVSGTQATFSVTNNPEGKYSYKWILPSNWIPIAASGLDSTQVTVRFNNTGTGNITVAASYNGCGTKFASFNVNRYPATAPAIAGQTCVKFGDTTPIAYSVQGGNNTYTWEVEPAGTGWFVTLGNGPSINIIPAFGNIPSNGIVTVRATIQGNCGTAPVTSTLNVEIGPAAPGTITGATCVGNGTTSVIYSVAGVPRNHGYSWTIPPSWSVTGGTAGSSVTVNPNNTDGTIKVLALGCSSTTSSGETTLGVIMGPAMPGAITGPTCVKFGTTGMQYTIGEVLKATGFEWDVPGGWTKTVAPGGLTMTVTATNNITGDVRVRALGCSSTTNSEFRTLNVSIGPPQPSAIAGPVCIKTAGDQTYSITPPAGTNYTYSWSAPGWTIVGSATGPSITVTPGIGSSTISVVALGCAPAANSDARTLAVSVAPAKPGAITYYVGDNTSNICLGNGANQVVHFSIPQVDGATTYTWTVSPWNSGSSTTTVPNLAVVTDATSAASVTVIANGSVTGCNSEPQTMTLNRSGLQFCITADVYNSVLKNYVVYPEDIIGGTATYYEWYPAGVNVPISYGEDVINYPARNGNGTLRVDVTDAIGCKTSLSITLNHPLGYKECNYTPAPTFAAGRSAGPLAAAAEEDEPAASDQPQETVSRLQLFPNPVNNEVNILVPKAARKNGNLAVYNSTGQEMAAVKSLSKEVKLNVGNYPDGGYYVIITTPSASFYGRMVVKH